MPLRDQLDAARRFLDRSLFPESRPTLSAFSRGEKATLLLAFLAVAVVAQLARIGFSASLDTLWAEDGPIFVGEAFSHGFFHSLGHEYAGYLVLFPRLAGEAATLLPLRDAPLVVSILSALLVGLSGVVVWVAASGHIANPYLRGTLVAFTVLTPVGGLETIDSASYVSWYMLFASFWLLLWRPRTELGAIAGAAFIALAALSNPGVWFFAPVALLRAVCVRDRRDLTILAGYFLPSIVQAGVLAGSSYEAVEPVWTPDIWTVLLQRVLDGAAFGLRLGGVVWEHLGWVALIALGLLAVAGLILGWRRSGWGPRALALVALPTAMGMFVISVYQRAVGAPMLWPANDYFGAAGRYSIVPVLLVISVAFAFIDSSKSGRGSARRPSPLVLGAVALSALSIAVSIPAGESAARGGQTWGDSVDVAAAACAANPTGTVAITSSPPGFAVGISCGAVPGSSDGQR